MSDAMGVADEFSPWIGRRQDAVDVLEPSRTNALSIALGRAGGLKPGAPLPLLHHWLYFWDVQPPQGLGADGHSARGDFLPPSPLPRRMWAGGRLRFLKPLRVGERVSRVSTIVRAKSKSGRSGALLLVTARHDLSGADGLAIIEEQDIVYREAASPASAATAAQAAVNMPPTSLWRSAVKPDPVLLFRYSALTLNGHRIHYDQPYATREEGYPNLVVHGPLQATLLINLSLDHLAAPLIGFEFRSEAPAFAGSPLLILGDPSGSGARLRTEQGGRTAMTAAATSGEPP